MTCTPPPRARREGGGGEEGGPHSPLPVDAARHSGARLRVGELVALLLDLLVGPDLLALLAELGERFLIFLSSLFGIFFFACFSSILLPKASNLSSLVSEADLAASFSAFLRAFSAASIHSEPETVQRPSTTDQTSGQSAL